MSNDPTQTGGNPYADEEMPSAQEIAEGAERERKSEIDYTLARGVGPVGYHVQSDPQRYGAPFDWQMSQYYKELPTFIAGHPNFEDRRGINNIPDRRIDRDQKVNEILDEDKIYNTLKIQDQIQGKYNQTPEHVMYYGGQQPMTPLGKDAGLQDLLDMFLQWQQAPFKMPELEHEARIDSAGKPPSGTLPIPIMSDIGGRRDLAEQMAYDQIQKEKM